MKDYEYNRIFLPYVIQKIEDETGGWVILNREYKFLGTTNWSFYEDTPRSFRIARITDETKQQLNNDNDYNDRIYLFDGSCSPLSKNAFRKHRLEYSRKVYMVSLLKTFDNESLRYLLLTAIERINTWNLPYEFGAFR